MSERNESDDRPQSDVGADNGGQSNRDAASSDRANSGEAHSGEAHSGEAGEDRANPAEPNRGKGTVRLPRPRGIQRWFRFSLRTLLIVAPLTVIIGSWFASNWYRDYLHQQAVAAINAASEKMGAQVIKNTQGEITRVYLMKIDNEQLKQLAAHLRHLPKLEELDIVASDVTDEGLSYVEGIPQIRLLYLHKTQVTDKGMARLEQVRPKLVIRQSMPDPIAIGLAGREIFNHALMRVAFSRGGRYWATGSGDGSVRLYHGPSRRLVHWLAAHDDWAFSVAFHPNGKILASGGGDDKIKLWRVSDGKLIATLAGHEDDVHSIAFNHDGTRLVSSSDDYSVRVWDVVDGRQMAVLEGHEATIPAVAVSPDGRLAASGSRDDTVRIWDLTTLRPVATLRGHTSDVMAVAFDPSGGTLASVSYDGTLRLWDVASRRLEQTVPIASEWLFSASWSEDGRQLAVGHGKGITLLRRRAIRATARFQRLRDFAQKDVSSSAFAPVGGHLAAASAEGNVAFWNPATGRTEQVIWTRFGERGLDLPLGTGAQ